MRNILLAVVIAVSSLIILPGCGSSKSYVRPSSQKLKTLKTIGVSVDGDAEFIHIGKNASESVGLVMFTGLVGAIIDSASRSNKDKEEAEAIKPEEVLLRGRQGFANTLVTSLQESQRFDTVKNITNHNNNYDAVLDIEIAEWGTRMKHEKSDIIIPYIKVYVSLKARGSKKMIWSDTQTTTYDTNHSLYDYKWQKAVFESDFQSVINKSAKQIVASLLDFYSL
jgi:hypothetical protein